MSDERPPKRLRVLVVEDEFFVAAMLTDLVEGLGYAVQGPAHSVEAALALLEAERPAGALLDVNLGATTAEPIAHALDRLSVPYLFLTGYSRPQDLPAVARNRPRLSKPVEPNGLRAAVERMLDRDG